MPSRSIRICTTLSCSQWDFNTIKGSLKQEHVLRGGPINVYIGDLGIIYFLTIGEDYLVLMGSNYKQNNNDNKSRS